MCCTFFLLGDPVIVSGGSDRSIRVLHVYSGELIKTLPPGDFAAAILSIDMHPFDEYVSFMFRASIKVSIFLFVGETELWHHCRDDKVLSSKNLGVLISE